MTGRGYCKLGTTRRQPLERLRDAHEPAAGLVRVALALCHHTFSEPTYCQAPTSICPVEGFVKQSRLLGRTVSTSPAPQFSVVPCLVSCDSANAPLASPAQASYTSEFLPIYIRWHSFTITSTGVRCGPTGAYMDLSASA